MGAFHDILGQGQAIELLERMLDRDRVPHAMLFQGPDGVGKATTAARFANVLLCLGGAAVPCGRCEACTLLAGGNHPDYLYVTRRPAKEFSPSAKKGDLSRDIRIEQIRQLGHLAGQKPRIGARRVFVVDPAERMNIQAQNALLKTLEEPGSATVLILVSGRPQLMLPTVRSRSFAVRFVTLRAAELASLLEVRGLGPDEAKVRASLADGRPGRAIDLDIDALQRRRQALLALLDRVVMGPANADAIMAQSKGIAGADEAEFLANLDLLESLVRDGVRAAIRADDPALIHADIAPQLARFGGQMGAERGSRLLQSIEALRSEMIFTPNRPLMVEALLAAAAGGPFPRARLT